jgi:phosphate transport system substrate-binding protein
LLHSRKHWRVLLAVLAAFALLIAACGGDDDDSSSNTTAGNSPTTAGSNIDYSKLSGTLNGSGSSFQAPFNEAAIAGLAEKAPNLTVNYGAGGSGKGKTDLLNGVVDFAGTDSLVKPEDLSKYAGGLLYFPTVAAPITVSYNLSGVDTLKLDADTLAKIFSGQIKTWDDSAIKALNDGVDLPSTDIVIAHRSDASGTTNNFTHYLTLAAPTTWKLGTGDTVPWPASSQAGNGNTGVAQIVKSTAGAIGYVDYSDATASKLSFAQIKNSSGSFVKATLDGAQAAVASAQVQPDLTYTPLNASGADAYPITSPTYIIVYKTTKKPSQTENIKGWISYLLGPAQDLAKDAGFSPLPDSLVQKANAQIAQIQ